MRETRIETTRIAKEYVEIYSDSYDVFRAKFARRNDVVLNAHDFALKMVELEHKKRITL